MSAEEPENPSRGEIKRLGEEWERQGQTPEGQAARAARVEAARTRGVEVPEGWEELPGKKMVRLLLDRAGESQIRKNPIHRDEAFVCGHCGAAVPVGGRRPRDHCHRCLYSLHVDTVPGDRAVGCGGLMAPVGVEQEAGILRLRYVCQRCGAERRNRVLGDVEPPDDRQRVRALMGAGRG